MPTECERSVTSSVTTKISSSNEIKDNNSKITTTTTTTTTSSSISFNEDLQTTTMMEGGDMSTSQTSTTSNGSSSCNGGGRKTSITSPDPTAYVAKARVTRPTPPPPPYNPMQFVQIKPCNLYQTAQEQLKKAEEVKKIKEIRKEEPEDWQNNLDNWKSSRRKRVEHIIDRVVEVKKLELEEHDRTRRKSKTFSEMIEERGERAGGRGLNKLVSLAVYAEDESNDLSDLGIGTSSASGKSSLSEDYDNNSVMSDNAAELDKAITNSTHHKPATDSTTREYISSPGYETSSSTAPASSPDPCEYTYEGAIQDYKQRVSRAASGLTAVALNKLTQHNQQNSKESTPERGVVKETGVGAAAAAAYPPRRGSKIEDRLMGFEVQSPSSEECVEKSKVDVPKIDISKRKEIFEQQQQQQQQQQLQLLQTNEPKLTSHQTNTVVVPRVTLRDRFKVQQQDTHTETSVTEQPKKELKRLSGDITSIKERLQSLEQQQNLVNGANGAIKATANKLVDIPVPPLKERLSSLQNAVTKEEIRKPPVVLIDARQLEIMKVEEEKAQQSLKETKEKEKVIQTQPETATITQQLQKETNKIVTEEPEEIDRDDSGIHTADDVELDDQQQQRLQADQMMKKEQELKLNAAIEALAKEEQQLSEAANVVNQIEAEFEELTLASVATLPPLAGATASSSSASASATPITNDHMEYSVSSTNPLATKSISSSSSSSSNSPTTPLNHNENICSPSSLISDNNGSSTGTASGTGTITEPSGKGNNDNNNEVKVLDIKSGGAATNLRRKPTNEMVHAKNLLKIFKETFQNDSALDLEEQEQLEQEHEHETKAVVSNNACDDKLGLNIKTEIYENSNRNEKEIETPPCKEQSVMPQSPKLSNIPRTMTPILVGKPPMSPQSSRNAVRFVNHTPPGSPALARKNDSQFSINGRVEIFNSKTMTSPIKSPVAPYATPTSPTMTAKRTQMPYIKQTAPPNNILLPHTTDNTTAIKQQQQEQQQQKQITTVIEPLATPQQQEQQQQQMKSMPAQRMVNEPKTTAMVDDSEQQTLGVKHHQQQQQLHQANHVDDDGNNDKELVKQQQQHQPEVVVCAPPITIVNPDELPKPNTVKNLSSCFQQKDNNTSSNSPFKPMVPPKPLPRSRIPQATPPQSPLPPKRHICYSSSASTNEEQQNTASTTAPPVVEDNKKLSLISCSSNSSSSTDTTVIENDKKLSIMSQTSTTSSSSDNNPTLVKTNAQVHQQPEEKEQEPEHLEKTESSKEIMETIDEPDCSKPAKTLDKLATQALVEEMIKDDAKNRALALNTKYKAPLAPLKPNAESPIDEQQNPIASTPVIDLPETPVKTPTSPVFSNKTELFKTTTPLVVSTLYDKYLQEDPLPLAVPNNQRPIDNSSKKPKPVEPLPLPLIIPAELPNLPDCPPNESTLYKLANSAPHSPSSPRSNKSDNSLQNPSSPSTNSEKNLAIDSAICNSLLASLAATPDMMPLQRQHTVEEDLCQKVDKDTLPFHQGSTGFKDVTKSDIKRCDGLTPSSATKLQGVAATQRQKTVEEELCQKIDVHSLPDGKQQPKTGFKCISPTEIRKCDNFFGLGAGKPNSKPSSPIMQARAAHSKALIETCEKIIAEEKQANNQLKSSLPASPVGTPVMQRKSKIPLPITSCLSCKATESLNEADLRQPNKELSSLSSPSSPTKDENNGVIARMHVVETQIKVTTTTPPASPKITAKTQASPQTQKKTKNIFDFLKKNFGGSNPNYKEDHAEAAKANKSSETNASSEPSPKVLVLSEQELQDLEKVKYDEIHKFDNSKFYLPSHNIGLEEEDNGLTETPPPLPKTPAPVNIEITRKIITDEILEDDKTEQQLTQEIDDLLDDELNKLNHEIKELEKAGQKQ